MVDLGKAELQQLSGQIEEASQLLHQKRRIPLHRNQALPINFQQISQQIFYDLFDPFPTLAALPHPIRNEAVHQFENPVPELLPFFIAVVHLELGQDVEGRVAGLGAQAERLFGFEQQCEYFVEERRHLPAVSVVAHGPD